MPASGLKACVVVVDACSTACLYPAELALRGIACVHVQSTPELPDILRSSFLRPQFADNIVPQGENPSAIESYLVRQIREWRPMALWAGTETGVELADRLGQALELAGNGAEFSYARRHKGAMIERVERAGLRTPRTFTATCAESAVAWISSNLIEKVVLKPPKSGGTDGVVTCKLATGGPKTLDLRRAEFESNVRRAVGGILGANARLGGINDAVVVQEFVPGHEYIVNTVSCAGAHVLTDAWKYKKVKLNGRSFVYDSVELLDPRSEKVERLAKYTFRVLDALGIHYGPCHTEVFLDAGGQPVLVEVGARISGLFLPLLAEACGYPSQVSLTVDAYCEPSRFRERGAERPKNDLTARCVLLHSMRSGRVTAVPGEQSMRKLPGLFRLKLPTPGQAVTPTVDLYSVVGQVDLVGSVKDVCKAYTAIREQESRGSIWQLS